MANEVKKYIRITSEMQDFISNLAKKLNISENDVIKVMIYDYMEK